MWLLSESFPTKTISHFFMRVTPPAHRNLLDLATLIIILGREYREYREHREHRVAYTANENVIFLMSHLTSTNDEVEGFKFIFIVRILETDDSFTKESSLACAATVHIANTESTNTVHSTTSRGTWGL
jgi:hypothetical protein